MRRAGVQRDGDAPCAWTVTVDFDLAAYQRVARATLRVAENVAVAALRMKGRRLVATIEMPVFGSNEWRALLERY